MFKKRPKPRRTATPEFYPAGTFLETEKGYFYVFSPTRRHRFLTKRILDSWNPIRVVQASESDAAVERMRISSKMKFRNGSLIYSQYDGKMYLVSDSKLRHITNPDWLEMLGFERNDAVWVSAAEVEIHQKGEDLT